MINKNCFQSILLLEKTVRIQLFQYHNCHKYISFLHPHTNSIDCPSIISFCRYYCCGLVQRTTMYGGKLCFINLSPFYMKSSFTKVPIKSGLNNHSMCCATLIMYNLTHSVICVNGNLRAKQIVLFNDT